MVRGMGILALSLALGGCLSAAAPQIAAMTGGSELAKLGPPQQSDDMMSGGRYKEPWLSAAIKDASAHKLGSEQNPIRSDGPNGERAYLGRLRCADGNAPQFTRVGNLGFGAFGSIVDGYDVKCSGSSPAQSMVVMDMYFPGYNESKPVEGFTTAGR